MAFSYVRILELTVSSIKVLFNDDIDTGVGVNNVSLTSVVDSVANPQITSVIVENDTIDVSFRPMFSGVQYKLSFFSTEAQDFKTSSGEIISEDGNRNVIFITSPGEEESAIRDSIFEDIDTVYETGEKNLVRDLIVATARELQRASDAINTVKSANYVSILVEDELKTRDDGPIDKLNNGGAFEILRVASTPTGSNASTSLNFNSDRSESFKSRNAVILNPVLENITTDPISLQSVDVINERVTDDANESNYFDGLKIRVSKGPIIQVISVSLLRDDTYIEYNIERFGYSIKDNRYDTTSGSINVNLEETEIELSSSSITGDSEGFLTPRAGDEIYISYVYKKLGRDVDPDSVTLTRVQESIREPVPAIINIFSLEHAPIVTSSDQIVVSDGVTFLNTQSSGSSLAFTTIHPAFTKEIPFDVLRLPAKAGEYSINYETGEVYVYGEDSTNQGTGENAPVATYYYRESFVDGLDFTFNGDRDELSIRSTRGLANIEAKISFDYEDTFAAGTDYRVASHVEVLNERINNRLVSTFAVQPANHPVTDVFRIYNETTGEVYALDRFNDTTVYFDGRKAPVQKDVERERVNLSRVPQEVLFVSDELENQYSLRVLKIDLQNQGICDSQGRHVGANFDTSILFSRTDLFVREFFYENKLFESVTANINRLKQVGDYSVDYTDGKIYVAVDENQGSDLGDITYQYAKITTNNDHVLGVNNIYRSRSALLDNVSNYRIGDIGDATVEIEGLESVGERFINNNITRTLIVGTYQSGEDGITTAGSYGFVSYSGIFTENDIGRTIRVGSALNPPVEEVEITGIVSEHEVIVSPAFSYGQNGCAWTIFDFSSGSNKTITLEHDIVSVKNIYTVSQLGSLPAEDLDGYFDINRDSIDGNVITLGSNNPLQVGDAVVVNYNFGDIYIDYRYLRDNIIVSYEYGNNSLDWSISDSLFTGQEYYVTYKYGALRDALLTNFGSLTQIPQLTNFSPNLNREVYRSIVAGTLQTFIEGPTLNSLSRLVEAFTDVTPNIYESAFNNWVLGRDNLHLRKLDYSSGQTFDLGKFGNGVTIEGSTTINVPALAHIRLNEGTLETWVRPEWNGLANDSVITFESLEIDGYSDTSKVFIGFGSVNPTEFPFSLSIYDESINVTGEPSNINSDTGFFIWFDNLEDLWHVRWRANTDYTTEFSGTISTTGEFFNVFKPTNSDGYEINEATDIITSTIKSIEFEAFIDSNDSGTQYSMDGISFASGDTHYIFDMAERPDANRMSLFKDGTGYLNFQVFDSMKKYTKNAGFYNISANIRDWEINTLHHVAISWKFNSFDEMDEMHMFIDGEEVTNLFKYGGNPKATSSYDFGDIAEEIITASASKPTVGGNEGSTNAGSFLFYDYTKDFVSEGILVGDILYLLDDTQDGTGDPNFGTPYTVSGVGTTTLTLDRAPTLTLGNLNYTINPITQTVSTPVNTQDFIVVVIDANGNETELYGLDSEYPDYSVSRGGDHTHIISINKKVSKTDAVVIRPLGLVLRRCKERVYVYAGNYDELRVNSAPPISLTDVKITPIILNRTSVSTGGGFGLVGTVIGAQLVTMLQSYFDDVCQPSNQTNGRKLAVTLSGDNFNFDIPGNQVIIEGQTYSGAIKETIMFDESSTISTSEYWTDIDSITVSVIPIDASVPVGAVEVRELNSITVSENNGDKAEVTNYSNGIFKFETYGSGGLPFILNACTYEVDYPSRLRIRLDAVPDTFSIGSDYNNENKFDGIIDEFRILDYMSEDTRSGEILGSGETSITTDYNSISEFSTNNNTLLLLHFDDDLEDSSVFRDRYDSGFEVAPSVNENFGTAIKFVQNSSPYVISNAGSIFNNNEGTIEFWVNPLTGSKGDPNFHYYVDMAAIKEEENESVSRQTVIANQKIREVESVRLATDIYNTGINYFIGGSVSNVDAKTITLGTPLPGQNTAVKISYVPLSSQGDRVSIFRDPNGRINFFMKASGVEHLISVPTSWDRYTWHRVMVMWTTNSNDNRDRLRLFVDGSERGTIKYGTGLIYGTGVIWGQAEVRSGVNRFVVDNIDLSDTFAKIYLGTDIYGSKGANALIDNIRFSEIQRLGSIKATSTDTIDINYTANTSLALPVTEDLYTSAIYDFESISTDIEYLATIINDERGIFRFEIEVIDSFDKVIGDTYLETLLVDLIDVIKPAHCESIITYIE